MNMNDFTKEELEALIISIHHLRMLKIQREEFYLKLHEKIQSMIEKYCEHSWAFYLSAEGRSIKCQKCCVELK